jgi:hypothetical protein
MLEKISVWFILKAKLSFVLLGITCNYFGQDNCLKNFVITDFGQSDSASRFASMLDDRAEIGSIYDSKSSFEIRIYCEKANPNSMDNMTVIRCEEGKLIGKNYTYNETIYFKTDSISSSYATEITSEKIVNCSIPFASFMDSLIKFQFFELPSHQGTDYTRVDTAYQADGSIEISTAELLIFEGEIFIFQFKINEQIRSYVYENPFSYVELWPLDNNLNNVMRIIDHFDLYFKE